MATLRKTVMKAHAGTGKTYSLTKKYRMLTGVDPAEERKGCEPEEIIAITFTRKAAEELKTRIRRDLLENGHADLAERVEDSFIGTVDGICLRLLQEYALEAGISPESDQLSEEDGRKLFSEAAAEVMRERKRFSGLIGYFESFPQGWNPDKSVKQWIRTAQDLSSCARSSAMDNEVLRTQCAEESVSRIEALLDSWGALPGRSYEDILEDFRRIRDEILTPCPGPKGEPDNPVYHFALNKSGKVTTAAKETVSLMRRLDPERMRWKDWNSLTDPGRIAGAATGERNYKKLLTGRSVTPGSEGLAFEALSSGKFRDDLKRFIRMVFDFTAECMARYQAKKQASGLVDFADMEQLLLEALERKEVRDRLRNRFRALIVDEFQDTNPMQLEIFRRITDILREGDRDSAVIFVGDEKQSIYGFRGARPELSRRSTSGPDWTPERLNDCRRTVPAVIGFINEYFSNLKGAEKASLLGDPKEKLEVRSYLDVDPAFNKQAEEVKKIKTPPVRFWFCRTARKYKENPGITLWEGIVSGIREMVREDKAKLILDKDSGELREVKYSDITILCRTNRHCEQMAAALEAANIKACFRRPGLMEREDIRFCINAVRLLINPQERLPLCEMVRSLGKNWYDAANRGTEALRSPAAGSDPAPFGLSPEEAEVLARFAPGSEISALLPLLSPLELLDHVIESSGIAGLSARWEGCEGTHANLDALRGLTREYEKAMHSRRQSATLSGWLDWLSARTAYQADGGADAVGIWTYHTSKGLESPVVVLADLDEVPKEKFCGVQPHIREDELDDPLKACRLFWNPDLGKLVPSPDKDAKTEDSLSAQDAEALRLMYVGMTRARDILVLAIGYDGRGTPKADWLTGIDNDKLKDFKDKGVSPCKTTACSCEVYDGQAEANGDAAPSEHGKPKSGSGNRTAVFRHPVKNIVPMPLASGEEPILQVMDEGFLRMEGSLPDAELLARAFPQIRKRDEFGKLFHAWFAIDFARPAEERQPGSKARLDLAMDFCELWSVPEDLRESAAKMLMAASDSLAGSIGKALSLPGTGGEAVWKTEFQMQVPRENAAFSKNLRLDMLVEYGGRAIIVDHKCGDYTRLKDDEEAENGKNGESGIKNTHSLLPACIEQQLAGWSADERLLASHLLDSYAGQMKGYLQALEAAGRKVECWIHLPVEGRLLRLALMPASPAAPQ